MIILDFNCQVPFKRRSPGRGKRGVKAQELKPEQKAFNKALSRDRMWWSMTFRG